MKKKRHCVKKCILETLSECIIYNTTGSSYGKISRGNSKRNVLKDIWKGHSTFNMVTVGKKKKYQSVCSWFTCLKVHTISFDNKPLSMILTLCRQLLVTAPEFCL